MSDRAFGAPRADDSAEVEQEILRVERLVKHFVGRAPGRRGRKALVRAIDGVDLAVGQGETLGLVGESGCGKSTLALVIMRLLEPTAGRVLFRGTDITSLTSREMRPVRREMQIVFQNPFGSLDQRMRVAELVGEPLRIHRIGTRFERDSRVAELLELVGLDQSHGRRLPRELSGGQQQRVAIARALALRPRLVILDEPVSALDVSVQAQVINLLEQIQAELGLAYVLISHDLSVVRHIADHVAVMYLGKIVETGRCDQVFEAPLHPYTTALLSAAPTIDPSVRLGRPRIVLHGDLPSAADPPSGCRFRTRCWKAQARCADEVPELLAHRKEGPVAACHYPEPAPSQAAPVTVAGA